MEFEQTEIPEVILVKPKVIEDHRGYFMESYHIEKFQIGGIDCTFVQDNHVKSVQNTLRGLHFQVKYPQAKLLRCLQGKIFDVAVDIRLGSPTFLNWHGEVLSSDNHASLFIPDGFSHGFQTMTDDCHLVYMHSNLYVPGAEGALNAVDPTLDIDWPLDISEMSDRDRRHPFIGSNFINLFCKK